MQVFSWPPQDNKGNPNLLRSAVILREYGDVICASPLLVQKILKYRLLD